MLNKQNQLEKAVVDTKAAFDVAYDAWDTAGDYTEEAEEAAWVALVKAKLDLLKYLKEQQDNG